MLGNCFFKGFGIGASKGDKGETQTSADGSKRSQRLPSSLVRNFISYETLSCAKCVPQSSQPAVSGLDLPWPVGGCSLNAMISVGQTKVKSSG